MFTYPITQKIQLPLCCYENRTNKIQVGRISNIPSWYFERVIFPGQRLIFEAPLEAELEIYTGEVINAILSAKICCDRLQIHPLSSST